MRDILFRAKRIDNGEWVEGYYIYHIKRTLCPFGDSVKPEDEQHVIMQDGFSDWNMPRNTVAFDIEPETVCQYTGLKDKNGEKVFIGDIIRCTKGCTHKVIWMKEYAGTFIGGMPAVYLSGLNKGYAWTGEEEIVGNIFDNPERLKEGGSNGKTD